MKGPLRISQKVNAQGVQLSLLTATLALAVVVFVGCSSTDGGGSASASAYYSTGLYDPWYHGGSYDDPDLIVTPPPSKPEPPLQPTHPIAPPPVARPQPMPMPSIPSTPRASFRR
jgi:hypothetical protein